MFNPNDYTAYRYHGTMLYIDPKATASDMKRACPLFFENARRGEKRTVYRGHIIVEKRTDFTGAPNTLTVSTYAFDVRQSDTNCIDTDAKSLKAAKAVVDAKMDTPEANPLTLSYEEVEVTVTAKVKVGVFREASGKLTHTEVSEWVSVGESGRLDKDNPGNTFTSEVWSKAGSKVRDQK